MQFFKVLIFFFLLLLFEKSFAQDASDYLITTKLDTLTGDVEFPLSTKLHDQILIKTGKKKKSYFKAFEVRKAQKDGNNYYPVKFGEVYRMMKLESEGYISMYKYREERSSEFLSTYLLKKDGDGIQKPNRIFFKSAMKNFLSECDLIQIRLNNGDYKIRDLDRLISDYNEICIQSEGVSDDTIIESNTTEDSKTVESPLNALRSEELNPIINDIQGKINSGDEIPGYLLDLLKSKVKDKDQLQLVLDYINQHNSGN
ncbi:MAG: hypothetical protein AAF363_17050 [Bacteroidota bacterium]